MNYNYVYISGHNELISKETQENLERALKESGFIKYNVSVAIIQGEARVGKTCIKSLILELPYSELSTSCIEAPCMAFGSFSINRYGRTDGKKWTPVSEDEIDDIVITNLQEIASTRSEDLNETMQSHDVIIEQNITGIEAKFPIFNDTPEASHHISSTSNVIEDPNKGSTPVVVNLPVHIDEHRSYTHVEIMHVEEIKKDKLLQNFDILSYLKEKCHASRYGFDRDWLYFFDSGGQIQFQKLLLAFMPCSSVLILVVNLSKSLSDQASTLMKLTDATINVDKYSLKVEDMLKQVLSAVVSNTRQFRLKMGGQLHIKVPENDKLPLITIGTHRDEYDNKFKKGTILEDIKTKREKLNSILQSESICITYENDTNILHEVDGSKAKRGEFDDPVIKTISEALKQQAYEIEVPFKWHYFAVILRKKAKDTNGILKLSSCIGFGDLLDMSKGEVMSALQFFHALKLLFHYHDSPAKDIVFVKLDVLIEIIRKLMIKVCESHNNRKAARKELVQLGEKGYLSIEYLKEHAGPLRGSENILLGLFEYLKIAIQLPSCEYFFMPALLPVRDVSDFSTFSKTPPLLFYFNEEPVPMGLFCAVIVRLLSYSGDEKWDIITEELNYSNFFTLQIKKISDEPSVCRVILVEQLYCIEIYCKEHPHRQSTSDSIKKAINNVMKSKKTVPAFYCSSCNDGVEHVAIVEDNVFMRCKYTNALCKLSDPEYLSWFSYNCEKKKNNSTLQGEYKSYNL